MWQYLYLLSFDTAMPIYFCTFMFTRAVAVTSYIKGITCVLHATWLLWSGGGEIIFSAYLCAQVWDEDLPRRVRRALATDYLLELSTYRAPSACLLMHDLIRVAHSCQHSSLLPPTAPTPPFVAFIVRRHRIRKRQHVLKTRVHSLERALDGLRRPIVTLTTHYRACLLK